MLYNIFLRGIAGMISVVSPKRARMYLQEQERYRSYNAARRPAYNRKWRPAQTSAAQEIKQDWQDVTNAARDLCINNSHAAGLKRRYVIGLIGEGSWPRPKVLNQNAPNKYDFDRELNEEILNRWERFAPHACANGDSFYQLLRVVASHLFHDGGLLVRKVIKRDARGTRLVFEPIEVDRLDKTADVDDDGKGNRVVSGIQLDQYNEPIGYWILSKHPGDGMGESIFVPADQIVHIYDRSRASAISGITRLAPAIINMHNIGMYRQDTMALARVATGYGVFVETNYPEDLADEVAEADEDDRQYENVTVGGVHYLRRGEKISQTKPENPGTQYEPFVRSELRSASVATGMSYEAASNDGSQTNFAGSRQMLLFERAMYRYDFAILEETALNPMYKWFLEFESDFNGLAMPGYDEQPQRYLRVQWSRPKVEWVDPLKDIKAVSEEVRLGGSTLTDYAESRGRDIEEIVATKKYEKELFEQAGIYVGDDVGVPANSRIEQEDEEEDAEQEQK